MAFPESEAVLIARFALVVVYFYMFWFFRKNFLKSKESGFVNKFFVGYAFFFLALFIFQIGMSLYTLSDYLAPGSTSWLRTDFPGADNPANTANLFFLYNLVLPLYITGVAFMLVLIAGQIYPLELTLNWSKSPGTKYLLIVAAALMPVFIPAVTWTIYTFVVCLAALIGVVYGLFMNIFVNIKIAAVSTGDLRRRSIAIIFASILFYLGFIWTLEIGEISLGRIFDIPGYTMQWDIVFGCFIQGISALLYRQGLKIRG
nr:hypothetical protein [Candidatus Sigynarchaeota archaeon]